MKESRPLRLADLDPDHRSRAIGRSGAIIVVAVTLILGAFYALPFDHFSSERTVLRLSAVVSLIVVVFIRQSHIRRLSAESFIFAHFIEDAGARRPAPHWRRSPRSKIISHLHFPAGGDGRTVR